MAGFLSIKSFSLSKGYYLEIMTYLEIESIVGFASVIGISIEARFSTYIEQQLFHHTSPSHYAMILGSQSYCPPRPSQTPFRQL